MAVKMNEYRYRVLPALKIHLLINEEYRMRIQQLPNRESIHHKHQNKLYHAPQQLNELMNPNLFLAIL